MGRDELAAPRQLEPSQVDPAEAGRVAREILRGADYRQAQPSPLQRLLRWLGDLLSGFGPEADVGASGGYWFGIVLLVVAVALVAWMLWRFLPRHRRRVEEPRDEPVASTVSEADSRRELLARAAAAEAEGRWDDAVVSRFRALVLGLARRDVLPDDPAATIGELRRSLRGDEQARSGFADASVRFEEVRYGGDPAGPDDARRIEDWDRRLVGRRP